VKFGSTGLTVNGKLFALVTQGTLVVDGKLPRDFASPRCVSDEDLKAVRPWPRPPDERGITVTDKGAS